MIAAAFDEAEARDHGHLRTWVVLVDGAEHQLRLIRAPDGALVFSVHHPITDGNCRTPGYHRTELISERWSWDGQPVTARMCRRPLSALFDRLRQAGFVVDVVDEPRPEAADGTGDREVMHVLETMPVFFFIRAVRAQARSPERNS